MMFLSVPNEAVAPPAPPALAPPPPTLPPTPSAPAEPPALGPPAAEPPVATDPPVVVVPPVVVEPPVLPTIGSSTPQLTSSSRAAGMGMGMARMDERNFMVASFTRALPELEVFYLVLERQHFMAQLQSDAIDLADFIILMGDVV